MFITAILTLATIPNQVETPSTFDSQAWMDKWERNILSDEKNRYCDKETGEELGWLVSPFLDGFYNGYLATRNIKWVDHLVDWADSWIVRGVKEPDGAIGWPKAGTGGMLEDEFFTDSLLGEAMALRPIVLISREILRNPSLNAKYGSKAHAYIRLAEKTFEKWDRRGCWRETSKGGVWVVPAFGIDKSTGKWSDGYDLRGKDGFTEPANKQNLISEWMIAMYDVTQKPVYRQRAESWWRVMRSRMRLREAGKYFVWDYWNPAGPWDYKRDGTTRHWVGVHPNGGYYSIDVGAIADAFKHSLVFTREDINRLIATNRDFMWNRSLETPKFKRIDGEATDARWKNSPGVIWGSLCPYDKTLQEVFVKSVEPGSWGGLASAPWFVANMATHPKDLPSLSQIAK